MKTARGWATMTTVAVAVAGIAAGTTLLAAPAANAASVGDVAIDKNFADPSILKSGKTYYAYATGGNAKGAFPYATAPSMAGPWTKHGRSMPDKPAWVGPNSDGDYTFWAPSVFRNEQGTYVMYFTANKKGSSDRCIGAAVSNAAKGPFKALRNPLVCRKGSEVIDPTEVKRGGQRYVLYKVNDHRGHFQIRIQKVDQRGLHTTGDPKVLIEKSRQIEAPDATYHNGKVYFFVSRFSYTNCSYRTDVYRARSLTSGDWHFVKTLMSTRNTGRCGPGGAEVRTMDGKLWMVFHAWKCAKNARCDAGSKSEKARYRAMLTSRLGWGPNGPKLIKDKPSQPKPSSTRPEPSSTATGTAAPTASDAAPGGGGGGGENAPAPKAGEKELPVTGMAVGGLLALGLGAFVVGLVIRATTRRRRTGTS